MEIELRRQRCPCRYMKSKGTPVENIMQDGTARQAAQDAYIKLPEEVRAADASQKEVSKIDKIEGTFAVA